MIRPGGPRDAARTAAGLLLALAAACASTAETQTATPEATAASTSESSPEAGIPAARVARADSLRASYTEADVAFMQGMIHHHAQALVMTAMAPSHGARERLLTLTARITSSQRDEIGRMQRWLEERGEPAPEVGPDGTMEHAGHMEPMPGMLTKDQMAELDRARGEDFDRLFLIYMIQHHQGALTMVDELFSSYGAGQGDAVFQLASDIAADQASEIERMQTMLRPMIFQPRDPS